MPAATSWLAKNSDSAMQPCANTTSAGRRNGDGEPSENNITTRCASVKHGSCGFDGRVEQESHHLSPMS